MRALLRQGLPAEEAGLAPSSLTLQRFSERAEGELLAAVTAAPSQEEEEEEDEDEDMRVRQRALAAAAVAEKAALAAALGRLVTSQARPAWVTSYKWCHECSH